MKTKVIMLVVCALTLMSALKVQAQDEKFGVGLVVGATGVHDNLAVPVLGVNFIINNIYTDISFWMPGHQNDTGIQTWHDEKKAFMIHAGYEFKLFSRFGIIPIIGYSKASKGVTDGSNWSISSSGTINNSYSATESVDGFDYGGLLTHRFTNFRLFLGGTRYAIYGGAAYTF